MPRIITGLVATTCLLLLQLGVATDAHADGTYRTTRIPLTAAGGAPGTATVVNIHANGPKVYAHELYLLRGATPGTYAVTLHLYPTSQDCTGPVLLLPSASIVTNAVGNGFADVFFTPEDAAGLRGLTVSVVWTFDGPAAFSSACNVVTLD